MVFVVSVLVANPLASQKFLVKQSTTCVYMQNMWKKGYVETRKQFFFPYLIWTPISKCKMEFSIMAFFLEFLFGYPSYFFTVPIPNELQILSGMEIKLYVLFWP